MLQLNLITPKFKIDANMLSELLFGELPNKIKRSSTVRELYGK